MDRKLRRTSLIALLVSFAAHAAPSPIDALMAPWSGSSPGAAVVVVQDGRIAFERAYGMADVAGERPMTLDTPVPFDSLTKQFTAATLIALRRRGEVGYDDPLSARLREVVAPRVTLRMLLRHRSGLPDLANDPATGTSLQAIVAAFAKPRAKAEAPGPYAYNNSGYALLAAVIERSSGRPFPEAVHAAALAPAGMTKTFIATPAHPARGIPHGYRGGQLFEAPIDEQPAGGGGMVGPVTDLAKWYRALDRAAFGGYVDEVETIDAHERHSASAPGYAAGWVLGTSGTRRRWSHGGSWRGSKNYVLRYPDDRVTVILAGNAFELGARRHEIAYRIAKLYLPALDVEGTPAGGFEDACVHYAVKRVAGGALAIDGADDLRAWRESDAWMHDPWPYGSALSPTPAERCGA